MNKVGALLPQDFSDLLIELCDAGADFVLVGGYAVAVHGHPRATKDIDIFVKPSADNAKRVFAGLAAFGAPLRAFQIREDDFARAGGVLQLGVAPYRIDIITQATGITFDEAAVGCRTIDVEGRSVRVIGLSALLKNKRATARPQDLADVAALTADEQ